MADGRGREIWRQSQVEMEPTGRSLNQKKGEKRGQIGYQEGVIGKAVKDGTTARVTRGVIGGIKCIY